MAMKRNNTVVLLLVALGVAGIFLTRTLLENFQLKVELASTRAKLDAKGAAPAAPAPAAAAAPRPAAPAGAREVIESARQMMTDILAEEAGDEKKLWIRVEPRDPEASGFAGQIATVFRDSGWEVTVLDTQGLRYKPGMLLLVASEDEPPSYVLTAQRAIEAIGQTVTTGRGYKSYYDSKKRENPDWQGTSFGEGQTYVLLVGRKPDPEAPAQP